MFDCALEKIFLVLVSQSGKRVGTFKVYYCRKRVLAKCTIAGRGYLQSTYTNVGRGYLQSTYTCAGRGYLQSISLREEGTVLAKYTNVGRGYFQSIQLREEGTIPMRGEGTCKEYQCKQRVTYLLAKYTNAGRGYLQRKPMLEAGTCISSKTK